MTKTKKPKITAKDRYRKYPSVSVRPDDFEEFKAYCKQRDEVQAVVFKRMLRLELAKQASTHS